ncbi:hypothetical protein SCUP234_06202 [Seiridium cupressi]
MTLPAANCRGFTHPVILLIRSSLPSQARQSITSSRPPCFRLATDHRLATDQRSVRPFTTGTHHCQQVRPKPKPSLVTKTKTKVSTPTSRPVTASSSYAQALAQRPGGAILYEGAGQKLFIFSSYMAGFACMGGAALNVAFNVYNVPPGVPAWTAYAFGSVGIMLAILGTSFILKPSNIVRRIRILPAPETLTKPVSTGYSAPAKVQIEVLSRKLSPIPGLPLTKTIVEPKDILLRARMYNPLPLGVKPEPSMAQDWIERKRARADYDEKHPMTAHFRDVGWLFSGFFHSLRRGITGEGFAPIEVNGQKLKLDISNGYVLEDGKPMDRILKIEPEDNRAPLLFRKT